MKFPDWMVVDLEEVYTDAAGDIWVRSTMTPRRWHPGYWVAYVRTWWRYRR